MAELELVGLNADGGHLILVGPDGHRHRLAVDDALRSAVRRDRVRRDAPEHTAEPRSLRPREIQTRLRAGESPEDIAREAGVPVENVRRYEGPVVAEQEWVAHRARAIPLGRDSDSPSLGDLVVDRLAGRDVLPEELHWSAVRSPGEPWEVVLRFRAADRDRVARWSVDLPTKALHALDDESRWLSETDLAADHRRVAALRAGRGEAGAHVYDVEVDASSAVSVIEVGPVADDDRGRPRSRSSHDVDPGTDELLDGLRASRGIRQEIAVLDEDDWSDVPPAHPPVSAPQEWRDASVLPLRVAAAQGYGQAEPPPRRGAGTDPRQRRVAAPERRDRRPSPPEKIDKPGEKIGNSGESDARRGEQGTAPSLGESTVRATDRAQPRAGAPGDAGTVEPSAGQETARKTRSRSRRTSVPSWDEIVFGAKPE